jgi:hypothetical protein
MNRNELENNAINTFDNIKRIYEETSFLLKDFSEAICKHHFESILKNTILKSGSSQSLDNSYYWITHYITQFYKPIKQSGPDPLLSISAGFYDIENKAVEPFLIFGIIKKVNNSFGGNPSNWLHDILYNRDNFFNYISGGEKTNQIPVNGTIVDFEFKMTEEYIKWPSRGSIFAVPLFSVKNYEDIEQLSVKMINLWKTKYNDLTP